jgi:hypothetical protein
MTSGMPPVLPGEQRNKGVGRGETSKSIKKMAAQRDHHPNAGKKGETANIKQNTTNQGFSHGRRFDKLASDQKGDGLQSLMTPISALRGRDSLWVFEGRRPRQVKIMRPVCNETRAKLALVPCRST